MTSRQKTVLWRWVLSIVVISSLLFLIPEYLPNLLPENLTAKETWISLDIHSESETLPLEIKHQFIDPLILGLIIWIVLKFFFLPSSAPVLARSVTILGILPMCLWLAYLILYKMNCNTFVISFLMLINILGPILKWGSIVLGIVWAFHFLVLGIQKYFQDDRENEKLKIKCEKEESETTCQKIETSD